MYWRCVVLSAITSLATFTQMCQGDCPSTKETTGHTDCYGDPLPPGAVMRLGTSRFREAQRCYAVAYSPDGKLLASGGYGGVVVWDAQSGKRRGFLESRLTSSALAFGTGNRRVVYSLAFSGDGRYLAAGCDGEAILWALATDEAFYLPGDERESPTNLVGFTANNQGVITGNAAEVRVRDWKTGKDLNTKWTASLHRSPKEAKAQFEHKALSKDGKTIIANVLEGNNITSVKVWDIDSGVERRIEGAQRCLLALNPDHSVLAVLDLSGVKLTIRDVSAGKVIRSWSINRWPQHWEGAIAFSPDGKYLATPSCVWAVATGKELCKLEGYCGPTYGLCFSPDGETLVAGKGEWVELWKMPTGKRAHDFPNHQGSVVDLAYSPDGRQLATAGTDCTVRLWDTRTGSLIRAFGNQRHSIQSLLFFPDGEKLATKHDTLVVIWNAEEGRELREIRTDARFAIRSIAICPDGKFLLTGGSPYGSGKDAKYIREWDVISGEERRHFGECASGIDAIGISPDGKVVAAASDDGIVRLWERATGELTHELRDSRPGRSPFRHALAFSPYSGFLATVCSDGGTIDLGDIVLGRYRGEIVPYPSGRGVSQSARIYSLAFAPDGQTIITSAWNDGTIRLVEVFSGQERLRFNTWGSNVAFAPNGKAVTTGSCGGVLIWDITGGRQAEELQRGCLSMNELERLWADLANKDATVAHRAIWALVAAKHDAVPFLRRRVRVVPSISTARLKELIDSLDSDNFEERERATRELAEQSEAAKKPLLAVVAQSRSPEQSRRAKHLLSTMPEHFLPTKRLRVMRAIEVFEHAGGGEAREALEILVGGAAGRVETDQARIALQKLRRQSR